MWLKNTQDKKFRGFLLLFIGIGTGCIAELVLLTSTQDLTEYFVVGHWWQNTWDNTSPLPGVSLYILAGIFFVFGLRHLKDSDSALTVYTDTPSEHNPKFGFWISSLGMAAAVAIRTAQVAQITRVTQRSQVAPYDYFFTTVWILSLIFLVVSVLTGEGWRPPSMNTILQWFKTHRTEIFVVTALVVAAFLIRFLDVEWHPYSFINDEGHVGSEAACIREGKCTNFFVTGWAGQSRLAYLPYAIGVGLLGRTALAVRLISVIAGTLSILAVYLFAREVFNAKIAWVSALLLSTLPVHVHFSRTGVNNIVDSLTAPLILWLLFRGVKRGSTISFLAAGIVAGLCLYTYPGSLLAPILGIGALGYLALQTRGFLQAHWRNISIFILASVIVVVPMIGYYSSHPDAFLIRLQKQSILQENRLQNQSDATGMSVTEILIGQFAKSSLVFIATDAPINFFNSPKAYLPPLEAIIFMLGMAYMLWRIKDPRYLVVFIWFWAAVILGSALTDGPPTSQRMLMSMPALVIIITISIIKTLDAFKQLHKFVFSATPVILLGLILYIGYANINYYFYDYRIGHYYEDPANELSYETRAYIAPLHTQGLMYLIGNPSVPYINFESFRYFSPDVEKSPLNNITLETLTNLPRNKDILFIALPNYKSDLEFIAQWIPGGEWNDFKRRYQPQHMLFYSYKITKEQLAAFRP